ncbi:helix-turn-helix transcriptional regulator [Streptomyces lunaelactis]|uniref:helix-turn-helix domain-containing protein n=1 Tax=Streptomyces lunaelactis TaxID=1535768 RepID=UPI001585C77F|nr:helix-turn-helix transcriptional regulator [Streptomyces lunaelactis]NUK12309.1 helix-turn-helix transcriptional regulator [Streptomyces lunaelactis]
MAEEERTENLAQLIKRLRDEYHVNESEIARRIGVAPATVNSWTLGVRGTKRGPNKEKLRALAREFPKFTEQEIFAAAGRKAPGDLTPEAEERLLKLFKELTPEQQEMSEIQLRALRDANQPQ